MWGKLHFHLIELMRTHKLTNILINATILGWIDHEFERIVWRTINGVTKNVFKFLVVTTSLLMYYQIILMIIIVTPLLLYIYLWINFFILIKRRVSLVSLSLNNISLNCSSLIKDVLPWMLRSDLYMLWNTSAL